MSTAASRVQAASSDTTTTPDTEELIRAHLPLVGHLVRELLGRLPAHVSRDELTSAGMMALVTSAQGFDASRGVPFGRFATIRIRGALTDELRSMDWASRAVRSKAREMATATQELTGALGRTPRREEIAEVMGVAVSDLDAIDADVHRASTLSVEGLREANGGELVPTRDAGPETLLVHREQIGLLQDAIAELPERLRMVVEQYFYGQRRMADIAAELGVTESRVSQLRTEALALLRDGLRGQEADGGTGGGTGANPLSGSGSRGGQGSTAPDAPTIVAQRKPSRRETARQAYVAAIASRSTLATRLSATTALGETRTSVMEGLRAAQ